MYKFTAIPVGSFVLHCAETVEGDVHQKRFTGTGVNTLTQDTANLYLRGEYDLIRETGETVHVQAGQCSLDLDMSFADGELLTEKVTKAGLRMCVAAKPGVCWTRRVVSGDFSMLPGEVAVLLDGGQAGRIFVAQGSTTIQHKGRTFVASLDNALLFVNKEG